MAFRIKDTVEANLNLSTLDKSGNLVNNGKAILKQLPNGELLECLGYFHALARDLKLPYEGLLKRFKQHHQALLRQVEENV